MKVEGEEIKEEGKFKYLKEVIGTDGGLWEEVSNRLMEGRKVWETLDMERELNIYRSKMGTVLNEGNTNSSI